MNEMIVKLHIERLPENVFLATSDSIPGLVAQGRTIEETIEIARDVARRLVESCREHGDPIPAGFVPASEDMELLAAVGV